MDEYLREGKEQDKKDSSFMSRKKLLTAMGEALHKRQQPHVC